MRIAFDAKRYYHNNTGLGNYSRTLVRGLQKLFPDNDYMLYDEKSIERTFFLASKAKGDACDILHGLSNEVPTDSRKIPTVCTIHDVCWRTFPEMYHFFDRKMYDIKYGSSCKRADKIIAISESTKRDIIDIYHIPEDKIEVIYQPVNAMFYDTLDSSARLHDRFPQISKDYILYVGSINARKNLLSVLEAMVRIPKDERPLLVVVGNGHEYKHKCDAFISSHNLDNNVVILGNVNATGDLQLLYSNAIAFVYPSFYEGFGLPVVEAALQHTPVITSNVSSLPEAAGPDACLIDPHSQDAAEHIAHYIERLCCDTEFHDTVADKVERYAREYFTPDFLFSKVMKLYERVVENAKN